MFRIETFIFYTGGLVHTSEENENPQVFTRGFKDGYGRSMSSEELVLGSCYFFTEYGRERSPEATE